MVRCCEHACGHGGGHHIMVATGVPDFVRDAVHVFSFLHYPIVE